ncbi:cellulose 1,4-beta-cellobiosidase, partial [Thermomonospora echinospora]
MRSVPPPGTRGAPPGRRRGLAAGAAALLMASGLVTVAGTHQASAAVACKVVYKKNDWGTGFTTSIDITNTGDALTG